MTEARVAREGVIAVHHTDEDDTSVRVVRQGAIAAHHFPEANTNARVGRIGVYVIITRPHGPSVLDDPPL